jgi:hypothetical protein
MQRKVDRPKSESGENTEPEPIPGRPASPPDPHGHLRETNMGGALDTSSYVRPPLVGPKPGHHKHQGTPIVVGPRQPEATDELMNQLLASPAPDPSHSVASELIMHIAANQALLEYETRTNRPTVSFTEWGWIEDQPLSARRLPEPVSQNNLAPELRSLLQRYSDMRRQEKQLRQYVSILAGQSANYGLLDVPPQKVIDLQQERERLDRLRAEIAQLEQKLEQELRDYADAVAAKALEQELRIRQGRIEQLVIDIKYKRQQAEIYERNLRTLEEQQAEMGKNYTPPYIKNHIKMTLREIGRLQVQLRDSEIALQRECGISLERLRGIELQSDQELDVLAETLVAEMQRGQANHGYQTLS